MGQRRIIEARARELDRLGPLVCAPLVGRDPAALLAELEVVLPKRPDLLEWRVDFFAAIADEAAVLAAGRALRARAGAVPLLLTRRSTREGGQPIPLDEEGVLALYQAAGQAGVCDYLDQELSAGAARMARARAIAAEAGAGLIASFHDFSRTPPEAELVARLAEARDAGADVGKVAVMPARPEDVLTLLSATARARRDLGLPLVTMAMGPRGAVSRLVGWTFGSAVTFAVGAAASAPGQLPIEALRTVNALLLGEPGGAGR